jgi:RHS repeat-associated protein
MHTHSTTGTEIQEPVGRIVQGKAMINGPSQDGNQQGAAQEQFLRSAPTISLPKGGGAIRGMSEKFAANPVTGTGSMTVPIATSPGRSGFGPQLSLSYDSGSGNGPFGFGWTLPLPSITRKTDKGLPKYQDSSDSDVFVLSGAEDLVPVFQQDTLGEWVRDPQGKLVIHETPRVVNGVTYHVRRYRPRIEGLFARIERWMDQTNPAETFWRSISKDNITTWYGKSANSRIADPTDGTRIFSWLICQSYDDKGNVMVYHYKAENADGVDQGQAHERNRTDDTRDTDKANRTANRYLKRIHYGNRTPFFPILAEDRPWHEPPGSAALDGTPNWFFEVVFDYEEGHYTEKRPDPDGRVFAQATLAPPAHIQWKPRVDPFSIYRSGFEIRTYRLCQRVLMFHHFPTELGTPDCLVRSTDFTYAYENDPKDAPKPIFSFLDAVSQSGFVRQADGSYLKKSLPPLQFAYTPAKVQEDVHEVDPSSVENLPSGLDGATYQWVDLDGEGLSGILTEQAGGWFYKRNLSPLPVEKNGTEGVTARFAPLERMTTQPSLAALSAGRQQFLDLSGDGQLDVVDFHAPTPGFYERTLDERWETFRPFMALPNLAWGDPHLKFVDLTGDGHADILMSEDAVFYWHPSLAEDGFGPEERVPQPWDEEKGARLVFADAEHSIYLADLSGDGLTDLVRIRNGEVCYWPNLGYGRFGAKVTMDHAPCFDHPDLFDPRRLQLADIDGSGTTDIIYLGRDGVHLYFNQSGNGWSEPHRLTAFPRIDDAVSVVPTDLLGNGTTCLVWSSSLAGDARRPMRYVNLMGGSKPHLLVRTSNNLGAETRIEYAPSTKFYLQDKSAGRPWITRLPMPVHVVERVELLDYVSRNRFVTRYAYHHGHFDGDEREFRGFGMVEQWDTEQLGALTPSGVLPQADNISEASHVPPVHTKTWFHTGVFLGGDYVSDYFAGLLSSTDAGEYFREPGLTDSEARALLLRDSIIPSDLTTDEEREACRALKGAMLRHEVYADDAGPDAPPAQTERAGVPYTVTEQNFTVVRAQARGANLHAVFFTHARESIEYQYERDAADPRVRHVLTLEVDGHGNVLKEVAVAYGRRESIRVVDTSGNVRQVPNPGLAELDDADRVAQVTSLLTYTESTFTNAIDADDTHRNPGPCEELTFELTGYTPTGPAGRFQPSDFVEPVPGAANRLHHKFTDQRPYEAVPTVNPCRRPIEWLRTLYRRDDLDGLLPLGWLEPLGLPGERYLLAMTPGLLAQVFRRPRPGLADEVLISDPASVLGGQAGNRGGFLRSQTLKADGRFPVSDADDHWWMPSGQSFFTTDAADTAVTELNHAREHFFVTRRFRDPFGQDFLVDFDAHDLLPVETRDAASNRTTVDATDYRVLQPRLVSDPNGNQSEVAFDTLGLVVGNAVMGKPLPAAAEGDSLAGFNADLTQAQLDAFFGAPAPHAVAPGLLQDATTRIVYDLDRFLRTRQANPTDSTKWLPPCSATLARESHANGPLPPHGLRIQLTFLYSDGVGRQVQNKIQAEPGPIADGGPTVNPRWVGSGWKIFNNKGKPVREYEPFFSATHQFEFGVTVGVSPVLVYDPAERVIAKLYPNHTFDKIVFGAWHRMSYDVNDTSAPRGTQTGDPRTDSDIRGYVAGLFAALPPSPPAPPWQTWHAQRIGGALGPHERAAAERSAAHADTPTTTHLDALGRPFLTVARNRVVCPGHDLDGTEERFLMRRELDIEGNERAVRDAILQAGDSRGRVVARYVFDMLGNRIHQIGMETGARWLLNDVTGKPIRAWDSRGHNFTTAYDALRRPVEQFVRGTTTASDPRTMSRDVLVDRIQYGEPPPGASSADEQRARQLNLRTRIFRHFDGAGIATNAKLDAAGNPTLAYDFKGNLLRSTRRLASDYTSLPDWQGSPQLEPEAFEGATRFDALNRVVQSILPHSSLARATRHVIQATFNEANLLDRVDVWLERASEPGGRLDSATDAPSPVGIAGFDYDAKGQRLRMDCKNGVSTFYGYDPLTFKLVRLYTRRGTAFTEDCENPVPPPATIAAPDIPPPGKACGVQNLQFTRDAAGNITHVQDDAQQAIYFRNQRIDPATDYIYDAVYRLIQATGREHLGQQASGDRRPPTAPDGFNAFHVRQDHPNMAQAMGRYTERYVYDAAGNFVKMQHVGTDPAHPGWARAYAHDEASLIEDGGAGRLLKTSNRLTRTTVNANGAAQVEAYQHDGHGNIVRLPHLGIGAAGPNMHWDYKDHLRQIDRGGGGTIFYTYNASGERVRKIWEKTPGLTEERIYLNGFEVFRRHGASVDPATATFERETLHVTDGAQRIALVEMRTLDSAGSDPGPARLIRYQYANYVASATLELDDQARVVSYEEYAPYGSSTYQAVRSQTETPKRYRFTSNERDEESGLYFCRGRYYAPWLGRWVLCDPAEFIDGLNLYQFVAGNPVRYSDPTGFGPEEQRLGARMEKASEDHQDAANARRAQKGMKKVDVARREAIVNDGKKTIPDEVKTTPNKGNQKVVDTKARHVNSAYNQVASERKKDIIANLDQVKNQLVELEKAGKIKPTTKGAALRVIHDSDRGVSSKAALDAWRAEANAVRNEWVAAGDTAAERALRSRVIATTTTREAYTAATRNLTPKGGGRVGGGKAGIIVGVAIAAYILFDSGDAWAAAQSVNPAANSTDLLASGNITVYAAAQAFFKDTLALTPQGALTLLVWELMQPRGDFFYDQKLADRAIAEGRNPFCAQCHGPGGALDSNNEWNQRAARRRFEDAMKTFPELQFDANGVIAK